MPRLGPPPGVVQNFIRAGVYIRSNERVERLLSRLVPGHGGVEDPLLEKIHLKRGHHKELFYVHRVLLPVKLKPLRLYQPNRSRCAKVSSRPPCSCSPSCRAPPPRVSSAFPTAAGCTFI